MNEEKDREKPREVISFRLDLHTANLLFLAAKEEGLGDHDYARNIISDHLLGNLGVGKLENRLRKIESKVNDFGIDFVIATQQTMLFLSDSKEETRDWLEHSLKCFNWKRRGHK